MVLDNVTILEITVQDPFGDGSEADSSMRTSRDRTAPAGAESSSTAWPRRAVALLLLAGLVAVAVRWFRHRGDDEADVETEAIEPGVERVRS